VNRGSTEGFGGLRRGIPRGGRSRKIRDPRHLVFRDPGFGLDGGDKVFSVLAGGRRAPFWRTRRRLRRANE